MSVRRPKRRHESGKGEESLWIYSYADMVSFLLIFFILFSSTKEGESAHELAASIAKSFAGEAKQSEKESEVVMPVELRDPDLAQLVIRKSQSDIEILLPGSLLFRSGSDSLSPKAPSYLRQVVGLTKRLNNIHNIEITGHTDSVPPAPGARYKNNWALSSARAGEVASRLIALGIDAAKVSTSGVADQRPLYPEVDENGRPIVENRAKNRRVHIVLKTLNPDLESGQDKGQSKKRQNKENSAP
jgi:chemotaxis protein MotB